MINMNTENDPIRIPEPSYKVIKDGKLYAILSTDDIYCSLVHIGKFYDFYKKIVEVTGVDWISNDHRDKFDLVADKIFIKRTVPDDEFVENKIIKDIQFWAEKVGIECVPYDESFFHEDDDEEYNDDFD